MGATAKTDDSGNHVSTGKLAPTGETHEPVWGDWCPAGWGHDVRFCKANDWCDVTEYKKVNE